MVGERSFFPALPFFMECRFSGLETVDLGE
jgi:hypothetical protein